MVPENIHINPMGSLENPSGEEGLKKAKVLKWKYDPNWNFQWGGGSNEKITCHVGSMDIFWSITIQVLFQLVYHGEYENWSVNLNKTFKPVVVCLSLLTNYLLNKVKKNCTYTVLYSSCNYESVKKIMKIFMQQELYSSLPKIFQTNSKIHV